jgi:hypothetical protein
MSVDRSDVVTMLGDLERLGLIERTVNPDNRRRNIVSITPAGSKQLRALDHVVDDIQERVLAPLSQNERRQLTKLLRKLADADRPLSQRRGCQGRPAVTSKAPGQPAPPCSPVPRSASSTGRQTGRPGCRSAR